MRTFTALARVDRANVFREPILIVVTLVPFLTAALARFGLPPLVSWLDDAFGFDLRPFYGVLGGFLILLAPLMYGMVTGFLLLDDRDEKVLAAIEVTPLTRGGYLAYRLAAPVVLSVAIAWVVGALAEVVPVTTPGFAAAVLLAAGEAPLVALAMVGLAGNKVEGLAVAKGLGIFLAAPFALLAGESPWVYLAGIAPPFWVAKCLDAGSGSGPGLGVVILLGLVVHAAYVPVLAKRFIARQEG